MGWLSSCSAYTTDCCGCPRIVCTLPTVVAVLVQCVHYWLLLLCSCSAYGHRLVSHTGSLLTVAHLTAGGANITRVNAKSPTAAAFHIAIKQPWITPKSPWGKLTDILRNWCVMLVMCDVFSVWCCRCVMSFESFEWWLLNCFIFC